jgi:hypothetical protein
MTLCSCGSVSLTTTFASPFRGSCDRSFHGYLVHLRKLLKDTIRGMILHWDVPVAPVGVEDENGDDTPSTREELELFFELVAEVVEELGEVPPRHIREIAELEHGYLGGAAGRIGCDHRRLWD